MNKKSQHRLHRLVHTGYLACNAASKRNTKRAVLLKIIYGVKSASFQCYDKLEKTIRCLADPFEGFNLHGNGMFLAQQVNS